MGVFAHNGMAAILAAGYRTRITFAFDVRFLRKIEPTSYNLCNFHRSFFTHVDWPLDFVWCDSTKKRTTSIWLIRQLALTMRYDYSGLNILQNIWLKFATVLLRGHVLTETSVCLAVACRLMV